MADYTNRVERLKQKHKLQRQRFLISCLLIVIGIATIAAIAAIAYSTIARSHYYDYTNTTTYHVESGDTLWFIASQYSDNRHDVRQVIYEIEQLSDCNANLQIGQQLIIPLYDCMNSDE